jgi:tetratricopeptide (TPR) repeat protein
MTMLFVMATGLPACTTAPPRAAAASPVAVVGVPFFPQEIHECGPAALATVLVHAGVPTTPEAIAPQVYLPGRRGSLQTELLAQARSQSRVPWLLRADPAALEHELRAGRPVLVLQNLLLRSVPRWHYAVVIAMDADSVTLRSGRTRELRMSRAKFLRTWRYADSWAFVALRPGEMPAEPDAQQWLTAYAALESLGNKAVARAGFEQGTRQWPADSLLWFAAGNARYAAGDHDAAVSAYRRAVLLDPQLAPAWNNLAEALADQGCGAQAREAVARARSSADSRLLPLVERTAAKLLNAPLADAASCAVMGAM